MNPPPAPPVAAVDGPSLIITFAGVDGPSLITTLCQQADEAGQAGDREQADTLLQRAIVLAEAPGIPAELLIDCLRRRAFRLRSELHYVDAAAVYERALRLVDSTPHFDTRVHAILLAQHADSLRQLGQLDAAEAGFRAALAIEERYHARDYRLLLDGLNNLAGLLHELQRPAEAVPYLQKAIQILHKIGEFAVPEKAETFHRLGLAHRGMGNATGGDTCLRQALVLAESLGDWQCSCRFRHAHYEAVIQPKTHDFQAPEVAADPIFCQHFLQAVWYVPLLHHSISDGSTLLVHYLPKFRLHPHLTVFDSVSRLSAWLEIQGAPFVGMSGRKLLSSVRDQWTYCLLNPGSEAAGVLSPTAVEDLRRAIPAS